MVRKIAGWLEKTGLHEWVAVLFFAGGFVWDGLTVGKNVTASDLWVFGLYLLCAFLMVYIVTRPKVIEADLEQMPSFVKRAFEEGYPYLILQFLYGSLLSALFILYFKSTGHWLAWWLTFLMGALLVANEFMHNEYRKITLTWTMLGLCTILFMNFAIPFALGSVHASYFYISSILGAIIVTWLFMTTPRHIGTIVPVWLISIILMLAYAYDAIPPVPLVAIESAIGYDIQKENNHYKLVKQASDWHWMGITSSNTLVFPEKVVCFSAIFAPPGLQTRLVHEWQYLNKQKQWETLSRVAFDLVGGRKEGYRGYTYKTLPAEGEWRVLVTTDTQKTIAVQHFTVRHQGHPDRVLVTY